MKSIIFVVFITFAVNAQTNTYKTSTDPNNACAAGFDIFVFWYSSFNDFDPMAVIYSGWAENFSVDAEYGLILQKYINGTWTTVENITLWNVGEPGIGWKWVYDGTVYLGAVASPHGNGNYRGKGWIHAWYNTVYAYSDWDYCTVNDVIAPDAPPNFSGSWTGDHPTLVISGNEETDLRRYAVYKKINNGSWNFLSYSTNGSFVDYSEFKYSVGNGNKRFVWYKATALDWTNNESYATNPIKFVCNERLNKGATGSLQEQIVIDFALSQNYPNPFNPLTTIKYQIDTDSNVKLQIYNLLGKNVKTLVNENKTKGFYTVNFDASDLPSGTYIYRLQAGDKIESRKMTLLK